ncbi:MAG: Ig-like domain-containing protein, partial [Pseudonocardia sp.]|nr:Ig-like domain-containing protein [Pseudonocardia sp.]
SHGDDSFVDGGDQPGNGSVAITWSLGPVLPVAVSASAGPDVLFGVPVTFTATITPPADAPACGGCSVAFSYQVPGGTSVPIGTAAVGADWKATSAPAELPPGDATVTAAFSGPGFQDSSGTYAQVTAGFSLATNPSPIPYDDTFDVVATPAPGQPDPTFVVIKDSSGDGVCVLGDGTCNGVRLPGATAGTSTWTAVRTSDSASFAFPVTFVEQTPTVTFTAPSTVLAGEPFQVAAKVAPAGGTSTPTGLVTLVVDGASSPQIPLDATGAATFPDVKLLVGTHTVAVAYLGEPGRWAAATSATAGVDALDPDVSIALTSSSNPAEVGTPVTYTATVTVPPDAPPCPACTVEFDFGRQGQVVVPVGPDTGWKAVTVFTWKTVGSFDVDAFLNQPARLAQITQTVVSGHTADVAVSTSPAPVPYDTPYSIAATVTSTPAGGPAPTGTVAVSDPSGAQVCTIELGPPAAGCGFVAPSLNPAGTETWTAAYSGDAAYPARTVTFPITRVAAPTTTTIVSLVPPSPVPAGQEITAEAEVGGGSTTPVTGNGQLYVDGEAVGQPSPLDADGAFFFEFAIQQAGTHTVEARYLGVTGVWAPSSASTQLQITADAPPPPADAAVADLVAAAQAASPKLRRAAEKVQAHYRSGSGACGTARALLAQIAAEQKKGAITADQAEDLTVRTTAVAAMLDCT